MVGSHEKVEQGTLAMKPGHNITIIGEVSEWHLRTPSFKGPLNMQGWCPLASHMFIWFLSKTLNSFNIIIRKHLHCILISTTRIFNEYYSVGAPSHTHNSEGALCEDGRQKTRAQGLRFQQKSYGQICGGAGT